MKVPAFVSRISHGVQDWLLRHARLRIERVTPRAKRPDEEHRYAYQQKHIDFNIPHGAKVLDIGSGGDPFPFATVLLDRYPDATQHRHAPMVRDGRLFVEADVSEMPFEGNEFDYVYCAHVLEHVPDPLAACREIMRVGRRGYIETPTLGKDLLFSWRVPDMHRWHVVAIADNLCFFEVSRRQSEGIRSTVWQKLIFSKWEHPMQDAFFDNPDVFNVMFPWRDSFNVHVYRLDGGVESIKSEHHSRESRGNFPVPPARQVTPAGA